MMRVAKRSGTPLLLLLMLMAGHSGPCRADPTAAGMDAYRHGDYAVALSRLRRYAELGHGPASVVVGRMYLDGQGVAANPATAARYFRFGADNADALAANYLAELYAAGKGVPRDPAEAVRLWRKAGHLGNAFAAHNLGIEYWHGDGVTKDKALALAWLNAGIARLKDSEESHRASFVGDRDALLADMTSDEITLAATRSTPEGPTDMAALTKGFRFLGDIKGAEGNLVVLVLVGPDGKVQDARLETPIGLDSLDTAALKSVRSATFAPKLVNGQPVAAWQCAKIKIRQW
jgi:TonB family protein